MNQLCVIVIYSSPQTKATELYTTLHEILIECDNVDMLLRDPVPGSVILNCG